MSIFQCLDETTGLLMPTCQYHQCDKDESGTADNCDVPPYISDKTNPPIIPTEPLDHDHSFKYPQDVSYIEIGKGDLEIVYQRMGGEDVILHHFILGNKDGEKEENNIDFRGSVQIQSLGTQQFNLYHYTDIEKGKYDYHIFFRKDFKGNVTDFKCDNES